VPAAFEAEPQDGHTVLTTLKRNKKKAEKRTGEAGGGEDSKTFFGDPGFYVPMERRLIAKEP